MRRWIFIFFVLTAQLKAEEECEIESSLATTTGLFSTLVQGCVSAITGDFTESKVDLVVQGPEPLVLERSYSFHSCPEKDLYESYRKVDQAKHRLPPCPAYIQHWTMGFENTICLKEQYYERPNQSLGFKNYTITIPHEGSAIRYRKEKRAAPIELRLDTTKGLTNCCGSEISAKTNLWNQIARFDKKNKKLELICPAGHVCYFNGYNTLTSCVSHLVHFWRFERCKERRASSNYILYSKADKRATNPDQSITYSALNWEFFPSREEPKEARVKASDGRSVLYKFSKLKDCHYLKKVEFSDRCFEAYSYLWYRLDLPQVSQKSGPDNRFLQIEYYQRGKNTVAHRKVFLEKRSDPSIGRVKLLKAPVGTTADPIATHHFFYEINKDSSGVTTVYNAHGFKTKYFYNPQHRLDKFVKYTANGAVHSHERYTWMGSRLKSKQLVDRQNKVVWERSFAYDPHGNVLEDQLKGALTTDQGEETYKIEYTYSANHLLTKEKHGNGKEISYKYKPGTDLLIAKWLKDEKGKIYLREFIEYDENTVPIKIIKDNGSAKNKDDFTNIKERHVTYIVPTKSAPFGLPELIYEKYLDQAVGHEVALKSIHCHYSPEGWLRRQDHYDNQGQFCYSLFWDYDSMGNAIKERNAIGEIIIKNYDANNNLVYQQGPHPSVDINYEYDYANRLIAEHYNIAERYNNVSRFTTRHAYDLLGNRVRTTDRFGQETHYTYDAFGQLIQTKHPAVLDKNGTLVHPLETTYYDESGNPIYMQDARGAVKTITYNARGAPVRMHYPDGTEESFTYNLDGSLFKKIDKSGLATVYTRDCFGRVTEESTYGGAEKLTTKVNRYERMRLIASIDEEGRQTLYKYDGAGRIISTEFEGRKTTFEYDHFNRLAKKWEWIDETARVQAYKYDWLNRVIEERIEDHTGKVFKRASYGYDCLGNKVRKEEETAAGVSVCKMIYDPVTRLPVKMIDPEGLETSITYDFNYKNSLNQRVIKQATCDPKGRVQEEIFDVLGRVVSVAVRDPFGVLLSYREHTYDVVGNLVKTVDGIEQKIETLWDYNAMGQEVLCAQAWCTPDQKITYTTYNKGQKEKVTKPDGTEINYKYDLFGSLQRLSSKGVNYRYCYNGCQELIGMDDLIEKTRTELNRDKRGNIKCEQLANGLCVKYNYDGIDRITSLTLPDGSDVQYSYDAVFLREVRRGEKIHAYDQFDQAGLCLHETTSAGPVAYTYDVKKRLKSLESPYWSEKEASYDVSGCLSQIVRNDSAGEVRYAFSYDALDHLKEEQGHCAYTYEVDSLHNRLSKNGNRYCLNALHQVLEGEGSRYAYDFNGNCIRKAGVDGEAIDFAYDALGRLVQVCKEGCKTEYRYDGLNRRLYKIEEGVRTLYLYADQDEIGAADEKGEIFELQILGGKGAVFIELGEELFTPLYDHLGSIVALYKGEKLEESYRYSTFGEEVLLDAEGREIKESKNPWRYMGKRYDKESGLIFFGLRYYDREIGKWTTPDPAGFVDGINLYAYSRHCPLQYFDKYGLASQPYCFCAVRDTCHLEPGEAYDHAVQAAKDSPKCLRNIDRSRSDSDHVLPKVGYSTLCDTNVRCRGSLKPGKENHGMGFVNGVKTICDDLMKGVKYISRLGKDRNVRYVHNRSHGIFFDLIECLLGLNYIATAPVLHIHEMWNEFFESASANARFLMTCHSQGAIHVRNALLTYPEELRKRILVLAIAPAAYIYPETCQQVIHLRAEGHRDFIPRIDQRGAMRAKDTIVTLKSHPDAQWFDHSFQSPTYEQELQRRIDTFNKTEGRSL